MNAQQALKEKLYAQGCNATPVHMLSAAGRGFLLKDAIGDTYTGFVFICKGSYAKMHYIVKDLRRLARLLVNNLEKDPDYFIKLKKIYNTGLEKLRKFYSNLDQLKFDKLSEKELLDLIKKAMDAVELSVGVGHAIEPFALTTDIKIKQELSKYIKDPKELNKNFTLLTSPVKKSFVNEAEELLAKIAKTKDERLIEKYLKEFGWIRNSYAGKQYITKDDVLKEIDSFKGKKPTDFNKIINEKQALIKELNLPKNIVIKIKATEFMVSWQDERKKEILIAIDYLDRLLMELSKKWNMNIQLLRYAKLDEINEDLKNKKNTLAEREKGSIYVYFPKKTVILTGKEYKDALKQLEKGYKSEVKELSGMTASAGTATGPVKVCITINDLSKVKQGDILVASMTRPEFVPSMKKAAAVITDEGGITCHAAIVSRELGIPCIIGTKIATKVLKDNDLVQVKGNHGLIIILKKD